MFLFLSNISCPEDRSFIEELYLKYEHSMYITAFEVLHHREDAEDTVVESMEIIIEQVEKFKIAENQSYLKRLISIVCRNKAIDLYRRKKRQSEVDAEFMEEIRILDSDIQRESPENIVITRENYRMMKKMIEELDPKYKDVVLLRGMGFAYKDIAKSLSIPEILARKRMERAKKILYEKGGEELFHGTNGSI